VNRLKLKVVKSELFGNHVRVTFESYGDAFNFYTKICHQQDDKEGVYSLDLGFDSAKELIEFLKETYPELKEVRNE
jgi:hypothetical protein